MIFGLETFHTKKEKRRNKKKKNQNKKLIKGNITRDIRILVEQ